MNTITHNQLQLALPEKWEDATIVTLLAPQPTPIATLHARGSQAERPSIVIRAEHLPDTTLELSDLAEAQLHMLSEMMDELNDISSEELSLGPESEALPALIRDISFANPEGLVRQTHAVFKRGDHFYFAVLTGSMNLDYDELRARFVDILNGLRFV